MKRICGNGIVSVAAIGLILVYVIGTTPAMPGAKQRSKKTVVAAAAVPIDPFVVEWIEAKAKEKQAALGKPTGPIKRVISEVSGMKGFMREYEHGAVSASIHGTYAVTGETYKQWKPRSGLTPYEFPKK